MSKVLSGASSSPAVEQYQQEYKVSPLVAVIPNEAISIHDQMIGARHFDLINQKLIVLADTNDDVCSGAVEDSVSRAEGEETKEMNNEEKQQQQRQKDPADIVEEKKTIIANFYLGRARELIRQWRMVYTVELGKTMPSTVGGLYEGGVSDPMRSLFEMSTAEEASEKGQNASYLYGYVSSAIRDQLHAAQQKREEDSCAAVKSGTEADVYSGGEDVDGKRPKSLPYAKLVFGSKEDAKQFASETAKRTQENFASDLTRGKLNINDACSRDTDPFYYKGVVPLAPKYDTEGYGGSQKVSSETSVSVYNLLFLSSSSNNNNTSSSAKKEEAINFEASLAKMFSSPTRGHTFSKDISTLFSSPSADVTAAQASLGEISDWISIENQLMSIEALFDYSTPLFNLMPHPSVPFSSSHLGGGSDTASTFVSSVITADSVKPLTVDFDADVAVAKLLMKRAALGVPTVFSLGMVSDQSYTLEATRRKLIRGYCEALSFLAMVPTGANSSSVGLLMKSMMSPSLKDIVKQSTILATCGPGVTNALFTTGKDDEQGSSLFSDETLHGESLSANEVIQVIQQYVSNFRPYCFLEIRYDIRDRLPKSVSSQPIGHALTQQPAEECDNPSPASETNINTSSSDYDSSLAGLTTDLLDDAKFLSENDREIYEAFYDDFVATSCLGAAVIEFTTSTDMCVSLVDWIKLRQFKYSEYVASAAQVGGEKAKTTGRQKSFSSSSKIIKRYLDSLIVSNTLLFTEARKDKYLMQIALEMANKNQTNGRGEPLPPVASPPLTSAKSARVSSFEEAVEILLKPEWQSVSSGFTTTQAIAGGNSQPSPATISDKNENPLTVVGGISNDNNSNGNAPRHKMISTAGLPTRCFPIVAKPVNGAGSEFVSLCYSWEELRNAFLVASGTDTCLGRDASVMCLQEYLGGGAKTRSITYDPSSGATIRDDNFLPHLYEREPDYYKRSQEYVVDTVSFKGHHVFTDIWLSRKFPMKVKSTRMKNTVSQKLEDRHKSEIEKAKKKKEEEEQQRGGEGDTATATGEGNSEHQQQQEKPKGTAPSKSKAALLEKEQALLGQRDNDDAYDENGKRKELITTTFVYDYQDLVTPLNAKRTKRIASMIAETTGKKIKDDGDEGVDDGQAKENDDGSATHASVVGISQYDINTKIIIEYTIRVLNAMDIRNGPSHCEIMLTFPDRTPQQISDGTYPAPVPKLIELNARPQGDLPRSTPVLGTDQFIMLSHLIAFREGLKNTRITPTAMISDRMSNSAQLCNANENLSSTTPLWPPVGLSSLYGFEKLISSEYTIISALEPTPVVISPQIVPPFTLPPYAPLLRPSEFINDNKNKNLHQNNNTLTHSSCASRWANRKDAKFQLRVLKARQASASSSPFMLLPFDELQYYSHYYGTGSNSQSSRSVSDLHLPRRLGCFRHGLPYDPSRALLWAAPEDRRLSFFLGEGIGHNDDDHNDENKEMTASNRPNMTTAAAIIDNLLRSALLPRSEDLLSLAFESAGRITSETGLFYAPWRLGPPIPTHGFPQATVLFGSARPNSSAPSATSSSSSSPHRYASPSSFDDEKDDFIMRVVFMYCSDDVIFSEYGRRFIRDQLPCFIRFTRGIAIQRGPEKGFLNSSDKTVDIFSCPAAVILYGPRTVVERSHDALRFLEDAAPSNDTNSWAIDPTLLFGPELVQKIKQAKENVEKEEKKRKKEAGSSKDDHDDEESDDDAFSIPSFASSSSSSSSTAEMSLLTPPFARICQMHAAHHLYSPQNGLAASLLHNFNQMHNPIGMFVTDGGLRLLLARSLNNTVNALTHVFFITDLADQTDFVDSDEIYHVGYICGAPRSGVSSCDDTDENRKDSPSFKFCPSPTLLHTKLMGSFITAAFKEMTDAPSPRMIDTKDDETTLTLPKTARDLFHITQTRFISMLKRSHLLSRLKTNTCSGSDCGAANDFRSILDDDEDEDSRRANLEKIWDSSGTPTGSAQYSTVDYKTAHQRKCAALSAFMLTKTPLPQVMPGLFLLYKQSERFQLLNVRVQNANLLLSRFMYGDSITRCSKGGASPPPSRNLLVLGDGRRAMNDKDSNKPLGSAARSKPIADQADIPIKTKRLTEAMEWLMSVDTDAFEVSNKDDSNKDVAKKKDDKKNNAEEVLQYGYSSSSSSSDDEDENDDKHSSTSKNSKPQPTAKISIAQARRHQRHLRTSKIMLRIENEEEFSKRFPDTSFSISMVMKQIPDLCAPPRLAIAPRLATAKSLLLATLHPKEEIKSETTFTHTASDSSSVHRESSSAPSSTTGPVSRFRLIKRPVSATTMQRNPYDAFSAGSIGNLSHQTDLPAKDVYNGARVLVELGFAGVEPLFSAIKLSKESKKEKQIEETTKQNDVRSVPANFESETVLPKSSSHEGRITNESRPPQSPVAKLGSLFGGFVGGIRSAVGSSKTFIANRISSPYNRSVSDDVSFSSTANRVEHEHDNANDRGSENESKSLEKTKEATSSDATNDNIGETEKAQQDVEHVRFNFYVSSAFQDEADAFRDIFASMGILYSPLSAEAGGGSSCSQSNSTKKSNVFSSVSCDRQRFISDTIATLLMCSRSILSEIVQCPTDIHQMRYQLSKVAKNITTQLELSESVVTTRPSTEASSSSSSSPSPTCGSAPAPTFSTSFTKASVIYPALHEACKQYAHALKMLDFPENISRVTAGVSQMVRSQKEYLEALEKLHETARLALHGGRPLPPHFDKDLSSALSLRTRAEARLTAAATNIQVLSTRALQFLGYCAGIARKVSASNKFNMLDEDLLQTKARLEKWYQYMHTPRDESSPVRSMTTDETTEEGKGKSLKQSKLHSTQFLEQEAYSRRFDSVFGKAFGLPKTANFDNSCSDAAMLIDDAARLEDEQSKMNLFDTSPALTPESKKTSMEFEALVSSLGMAIESLSALDPQLVLVFRELGVFKRQNNWLLSELKRQKQKEQAMRKDNSSDAAEEVAEEDRTLPSDNNGDLFDLPTLKVQVQELEDMIEQISSHKIDDFYQRTVEAGVNTDTLASEHYKKYMYSSGEGEAEEASDKESSSKRFPRPSRDPTITPYSVVDDLSMLLNSSSRLSPPPIYIRAAMFSALRELGLVGPLLLPDDRRFCLPPKSNRHWAFVFFAFEAECETQMTIPCTESKSRVEALFKKVAELMPLNALTAIGHLGVEKNCPPFSALLHPLVVPESLEDHNNSRTISLKTQPKFTLFEWQEPQTKQSLLTFVGDVAPMFLSSREPILASDAKALPNGSAQGLSVKFPVDGNNEKNGSIPLKPLEHLQPLRLGSLRALCSALLSADRPPTIKTLSQRIFDGNKFMTLSSKPNENYFRDLMEDLGAATPAASPFSSSTSTLLSAEKSVTKESSSSSSISHTMSRLLQWALFLSSPAGHVTPLSIIDGNSKDNSSLAASNYNTSSNVTAQQLRDKSFELQVRFYSFIDERCVLACHLPASSAESESNLASPSSASVSANGAPAVLSVISNKILTTLIKQQKSAVIESATSVHGLIPILPDVLTSSAIRGNNETPFIVDTTLSFVRKSLSSDIDTQKESDFDFDDNCSDMGSLASGVSGASNALHRVQLSRKNFLETFGPKEENVRRFRAITTISALIFVNIVTSFVKYVSTETLARLRALSSDPAAGNKALFSTAGLTVVGAIDMSWLDHILANNNDDHQANETTLNSNRSLFVDGIVVPCSLHQFVGVQKTEKALQDLADGLRKAAEALPKLIAEHHLKNPPNAADPDAYCTDTTYARVQRPVVNFLSRVFTRAIEGRAKRIEADRQAKLQISGDGSGTCPNQGFEATRAAEKASESFESLLSLDLTFSGWSGTADGKPSSLDIMVIKGANVTSPASAVGSGMGSQSAGGERLTFATTVQLEAIRGWAAYLAGLDADASTAARRGVLDTLDAIIIAALDNINAHPQKTNASESNHGKREREVNNTATLVERSHEKMHRSEDVVHPSIQRLHHLADLPFKVRFSWGKFYENPADLSVISTSAKPSSSASASASAGTLWSRTSHTEQHWVEKLEEAKGLISAEFVVKRKSQNKDQSAAVLLSLPDAIKALTSTAASEPTSVLSLVEILAKLDIGFELSANLAIRRLPSSSAETPSPPLGVVEWVLAHSDAVLRAKCSAGEATSNTKRTAGAGGFEALLAMSDPRLVPCLNNSEKNHAKLAQSDVASLAMSQVTAFVAKASTRVDRMKKLRTELFGFVFNARNTLDAYEALALEVADFLETELISAADKHRAKPFERVSFDEAQQHPLGLVAKGLGKSFSHVFGATASESQSPSIPVVDLDNIAAATRNELHCKDELLAASIVGDDKLSSSTCLTARLISEIGSFALAHSKRARRLRGLVRVAEELAKGLSGAIRSTEEEKWLVSC